MTHAGCLDRGLICARPALRCVRTVINKESKGFLSAIQQYGYPKLAGTDTVSVSSWISLRIPGEGSRRDREALVIARERGVSGSRMAARDSSRTRM